MKSTMSFNRADFYDAELRRHNERFRAALKIGPRDRVLDIGCGAGQSTREAARAAIEGRALGVDVSEELIQAARGRAAEEGLRNVGFTLADAQVYAFPGEHFDLCISRFGVMFFANPVAAFTNIGRALRPGARLAFLVWQERDRNEWATAIPEAVTPGSASSKAATFSLGNPTVTTELLVKAGFTSVTFADVHEPVFYGSNLDTAYEAAVELFISRDALNGAELSEALRRLRALLEAHFTPDGVLFDSRAWIVTACKA
jgi:SAM-dependent methyltransferase